MKKKILTCICTVTISAMLLAGCGGKANTAKEPTTTQAPASTSAPTQPEVTEVPETTDVPEVTETPSDIEVSNDLFIHSISDLVNNLKVMDTSIVHKSSELDASKFDVTFVDWDDDEKTINLLTPNGRFDFEDFTTSSNVKIDTFVDAYNELVVLFGTAPNEIWADWTLTRFACTWVVDETTNITLNGYPEILDGQVIGTVQEGPGWLYVEIYTSDTAYTSDYTNYYLENYDGMD